MLQDIPIIVNMSKGHRCSQHLSLDGALSLTTMASMRDAGINHFIGGSSSIYSNLKIMPVDVRNDQIGKNWEVIKQILRL